jgi:hypothetical protein
VTAARRADLPSGDAGPPRRGTHWCRRIVDRVDADNSVVYVNRTRDEIRVAPEFDEPPTGTPHTREGLSAHCRR